MVRGGHTTFVDRGQSPEILGTEVGKTFSGRKIWLHSANLKKSSAFTLKKEEPFLKSPKSSGKEAKIQFGIA